MFVLDFLDILVSAALWALWLVWYAVFGLFASLGWITLGGFALISLDFKTFWYCLKMVWARIAAIIAIILMFGSWDRGRFTAIHRSIVPFAYEDEPIPAMEAPAKSTKATSTKDNEDFLNDVFYEGYEEGYDTGYTDGEEGYEYSWY